MIWTLTSAWLTYRFGRHVGLFDEVRYRFRCLPTDIDFNLHLTNSRYASFMDIVRVALMMRNGAWGRIRAARLLPVLGSSTIRFRRAVRPFEPFEVTARVLGWDEKWIFIEHKILIGNGDVAALAIMKVAFIGPDGRVATEKLVEIIGYAGPKPAPHELLDRVRALDEALKI